MKNTYKMQRLKRFIKDFFFKIAESLISSPFTDLDKIHVAIVEKIETRGGVFMTEHKRPVIASKFDFPYDSIDGQSIVMQGPLIEKNDFTYQTLKLYAAQLPPSSIILSTWENQDQLKLKQISDLGITVCLNKMPEYSGVQNVNFQIASTRSGLIKAKETGARFVLKTRTDQRIYSTSALRLFNDLTLAFPVTETSQKRRLIITSLGTIKYRLYGAGDMLMYGDVDDMLNYWDIEPDTRKLQVNEPASYSIKEFSQLRLCEMYFCSKYFEKLGHTLDWTLKQSWELLATYFCVVDDSSIDLYWPKYDVRNEFKYKYYTAHTLQHMTFADWLSLYLQQVHHYPEEYLNAPFGNEIKL